MTTSALQKNLANTILGRDPNGPIRPRSSYIFFTQAHRAKHGKNVGMDELAETWKNMSEDLKKPYIEQYEAGKARYTKEKEEYDQKVRVFFDSLLLSHQTFLYGVYR